MNLPNWITQEPALWIGLVVAALGLAVAFGVHVTDDQQKAIVAAAEAVLVILGAVATRQLVTPVAPPKP